MRHFAERQEQELICVNKQKMDNALLDARIKNTNEDIRDLKVIHAQHRKSLGIDSVSQIPDLFPQRNKNPNPREEMQRKIQEKLDQRDLEEALALR